MQNTRHKPKDFWRLDSISTSCWAKEQICKSETLHTPFPSVSLSSYSSFYSVVLDCLHFRIFTAGDDEPSNIQGGERQTCGRRLSQRFSSVQYSDSCVARPWTYGCSIHLSKKNRGVFFSANKPLEMHGAQWEKCRDADYFWIDDAEWNYHELLLCWTLLHWQGECGKHQCSFGHLGRRFATRSIAGAAVEAYEGCQSILRWRLAHWFQSWIQTNTE